MMRPARSESPASSPGHCRLAGNKLPTSGWSALESFQMNRPHYRQRHVSNRHAPGCLAFQYSQVRMTMNDEVGFAPIEDHAELAVPQHPVLRRRLPTESGGRGREMGGRDSDVGF